MLGFVEQFDEQSFRRIQSVENAIKLKDDSVIVSMQSFFENVFKSIIGRNKGFYHFKYENLTMILKNQFFKDFIEKNLNFKAFNTISEINTIANTHKHDRVFTYDDIAVKKYYKCIFHLAKAVNNHYLSNKINDDFSEEHYLNLLNDRENFKKFIEDELKETFLAEQSQILKQIEDINQEHQVITLKLNKAIEEKEKNELIIKEYQEKEIAFLENEREIERLKEKYNKLRSENEEYLSDSILYENYQTINDLTLRNKQLQTEIEALSKQGNPNIIYNIDKYEILLKEKEEEINNLKSKIDKKIINEEDDLFLKYKETIKTIAFGNSYLKDDKSYVIYNLSNENKCTSAYQSIYAVINNILQRHQIIKKSSFLESLSLQDEEYQEIIRLEMLVLTLLKNGLLNDDKWQINYLEGKVNLLEIAIQNIFNYTSLICSYAKIEFEQPKVSLKSDIFDVDFINIKYDNYSSFEKNIYLIKDDYLHQDTFNIWFAEKIKYQINESDEEQITILLNELFNHSSFRAGQFNILKNVLNGHNTIGILPTSGGKSLIFQFATLLQPKITLVIAPINSLINDQIDKLQNKYQIARVVAITSDKGNIKENVKQFKNGQSMFVFISPERLQSKEFRDTLISLEMKKAFDTVVLDEVHCLSEWGHDFRIPYLMLSHTLNSYCSGIQYLGLTATASVNVVKDLQVELKIVSPKDVIFSKKLKRENLKFEVLELPNKEEMEMFLKKKITENYGNKSDLNIMLNGEETNAMVVFVKTKVETYDLASSFNTLYAEEVGVYNGAKKDEQDNFMNNEKSLLIATKAFGMGIDKPNIRNVYHYGIPSSREQFYQEAGRAGRDGKQSNCCLLTYNNQEYLREINEFLDLGTNVSRMIQIQEKIKKKTDLSTNFFFLVKDLNEPEKETKQIISGYYRLIGLIDNNLNVLTELKEKHEAEKIFYALHKIGIIDNWSIKYYSLERVEALIKINEHYADIEHIKMASLKYLSLYANAKNEIDEIKKITSIEELVQLILIIRKWYHRTFVNARREQLANMYSFVQKYKDQKASESIQNELEQFFDISSLIDLTEEGYLLTLEDETIEGVIEKVSSLSEDKINVRTIELERLLESTSNNNIELYTALINLRNNSFNSRNGKERLIHVLNALSSGEKKMLYQSIAIALYPNLSDVFKKQLIMTLFNYDQALFRNNFLKKLKLDNENIKYAFLFINEQLNQLMN